MNHYYDPKEAERVGIARESYSGRLLTDSQFDEAMAITGIIEAEIRKSGVFRDKLADYAHAFARTERFDSMKAESALRDLFKARTGQTMNGLREELMDRETALGSDMDERARDVARDIATLMKDGDKIAFHRAYEHQAGQLASELDITIAGAKRMMTKAFRESTDSELYEWGKGLEEKYYRPQIEAEKAEREANGPSRSRSGSGSGTESRSKGRARNRSSDGAGRSAPRKKSRAMAGPSR